MNSNTQELALIVGGSTGMGQETAKRLLQRGVEVILLSRSKNKLEKAKAELGSYGTVQTIASDLYDQNQTDSFIDRIKSEKRHIKYLVNSAGLSIQKRF